MAQENSPHNSLQGQREARYRWIGASVAGVALLGWLLALYFWSVSAETQDELDRQVALAGTAANLQTRIATMNAEVVQAAAAHGQIMSNLDRLQQQLQSAQAAAAALDVRTQALREEREALLQEIARDQDALAGLQQEIAQAQQQITQTSQDFADVGERLEEARRQEADLQSRVSDLTATVAQLTGEAAGVEERVQNAREAEAQLQLQVAAAREDLSSIENTRSTVSQSVDALVQRREELAADSANAEERMRTMQEMMATLSRTVAERSERLAELQSRIGELQQEAGRPARAATAGLVLDQLYRHKSVTAMFDREGRFQMTNADTQRTAAGEYTLSEGVLTLSSVDGDLEDARFPMRCRITAAGAGFILNDEDGSCARLSGVSLERVVP